MSDFKVGDLVRIKDSSATRNLQGLTLNSVHAVQFVGDSYVHLNDHNNLPYMYYDTEIELVQTEAPLPYPNSRPN